MVPAYDERPVIVALAGPDGAGKSTFYEAHLAGVGLRLVSPEVLARELGIDVRRGAEIAEFLRRDLVAAGESFVCETAFSDGAQQRITFLRDAAARGYTVVVCFIGVEGVAICAERIAMRVLAGGHDVARQALERRYARALENLEHAVRTLPFVEVFDNSALGTPHRHVARFEQGRASHLGLPLPAWFAERFAEPLALAEEFAIERVELVDGRERHTLRTPDGQHMLTITQPRSAQRTRPVSERVQLALLPDGTLNVQHTR